MPISVSCPDCNVEYEVPDDQAGQLAQCECGTTLEIPQVPVSGESDETGCGLALLVVVLVLTLLLFAYPQFYSDAFLSIFKCLFFILG